MRPIDALLDEYTEKDIFRSAIDTYGAVMQITVAVEEMSELQKELCKHLRGRGSQENIAEEIADVEIMMEQMKMLFNCEASVLQVREKKVKRLKERIEQNEGADWLIANGITVQDWISVKDRLPDATGRYLAVKKRIAPDALGGNRTDIVILRFFEDSGFKMPIHIPNWINEEINEEITYWMPLPEPPKGE